MIAGLFHCYCFESFGVTDRRADRTWRDFRLRKNAECSGSLERMPSEVIGWEKCVFFWRRHVVDFTALHFDRSPLQTLSVLTVPKGIANAICCPRVSSEGLDNESATARAEGH